VLFLDEPTAGLDPRGRGEVWEAVRALVATGCTALLTTQYLEEADQLADRISIMDTGKVIAEGTPGDLKSALGGDRVEVVLHDAADLPAAAAVLARVTGAEPSLDPDTRRISAPVLERVAALAELARLLESTGLAVEDLGVRRPTLDEVFLHLTGDHGSQKSSGGSDSEARSEGRSEDKEVAA
jgi:ABC-2 type transport system ATP-binding protein